MESLNILFSLAFQCFGELLKYRMCQYTLELFDIMRLSPFWATTDQAIYANLESENLADKRWCPCGPRGPCPGKAHQANKQPGGRAMQQTSQQPTDRLVQGLVRIPYVLEVMGFF